MQFTSLLPSSPLAFHPLSSKPNAAGLRFRSWTGTVPGVSAVACYRESQDYDFSGRGWLVDENMIVLRKRIHEMKMVERNYEPPDDWMEWEKRYYTSYDSLICEAMGVLQTRLMNTRPSLAFLTVGLISLSLPTSAALVLHPLVAMSLEVLSGILLK